MGRVFNLRVCARAAWRGVPHGTDTVVPFSAPRQWPGPERAPGGQQLPAPRVGTRGTSGHSTHGPMAGPGMAVILGSQAGPLDPKGEYFKKNSSSFSFFYNLLGVLEMISFLPKAQ